MPLIRIEMFPGRSPEKKREIAEGITRLLEETAGISPSATTIIFQETAPQDWFLAGRSLAAPKD
ncbi:MAG: 4-oxalocrotonate tautomerase family protein [Paracoccus sp. (in: a-proteobacteria)]|uniref:tautomerase family protein n=1 Tax=Paracoccus sp. TaxID=267 RepID=UPI0039E6CA16